MGDQLPSWIGIGGSCAILDHLYKREYFSRNDRLKEVFEGAVRSNQLCVLDWLVEHDYVIDVSDCDHALEEGHVATLDWLHAHQCPLQPRWPIYNKETLAWLKDKGYEREEDMY